MNFLNSVVEKLKMHVKGYRAINGIATVKPIGLLLKNWIRIEVSFVFL